MAEGKSEDSEKKPSYLPIAGALFLGIVVGAALSSGDEAALRVKRDLEGRLEAAESQLADALATAEKAAEDAAANAAGAAEEQVGALESKLAELESSLENAGDSDEVAAIRDRVNVLAEQMAAAIAAARSSGAAPASSGEAAGGEDESAASGDAAAGEQEGGTQDVAALEQAVGENGLVLAVGQTGSIGDTRVFMSRIDEEAMEARVMVVGDGPATIGKDTGPLEVAGGCALSLEGVADRRAYLKATCE